MKIHLLKTVLVVLCLLMAGSALAKDQVLGKGVTLENTILVSELLANPEKYVGQVVRIEGPAVALCQHRGCWVNVGSDVEGDVVRVKVKDGEIIFQPEMLGNNIVAQGVWTSNQLDLETTKKVCEHRAHEAGEEFDPEKVTECMTLYQLTGTGAVVKESVDPKSADKKRKH
jgi:hypothetical protein